MTLVPLVLYFNDRGIAKFQFGLAKWRRKQDKRQAARDRDWSRDKARLRGKNCGIRQELGFAGNQLLHNVRKHGIGQPSCLGIIARTVI